MMIRSLRCRIVLLASATVAFIGGFWALAGPTPQPLWYHDFADQRPLLGVPHACNVLSNVPFLIVGIAGMAFLAGDRRRRQRAFLEPGEAAPYWVWFGGLTLTGLGSAYYHAEPNNARLVWDRLPLAVALMGLFTAVLAERSHPWCARRLLGPLVLVGAASVLWWDWTEQQGAGDLRPYLTVQFFPLVAVPLLLTVCPPRYTAGGDLIAALACYSLAKILEILDRQVYTGAGLVSGHTLKHLTAALAAWFILHMLQRRRACDNACGQVSLVRTIDSGMLI
jgi:hypothetical protein